MKIIVNDKAHEVGAGASLADLLKTLGLAGRRGLAIAVNDSVVLRSAWLARALADGDRVLVIQATQGG